MQKDLLAELHLPELDIESLQNIVTQNSARLAYLIKENECLNKNKAIPLHFKEVVGSMVSDFTAVNYPKENIKPLKQKFIIKKSVDLNDEVVKNGGDALCCPTTKSSTIASSGSQECNNDDKDKRVESVQPSENRVPNIETLPAESAESNAGSKTDPPKDDKDPSEQKTQVQLSITKPSACPKPGVSILKRNSISLPEPVPTPENTSTVSPSKDVTQQRETTGKEFEPAVCIISEVFGNATAAFSEPDDHKKHSKDAPEVQLITPTKTNDITKIKGWRRKQFFVEKPTTIEFYSISKGSLALKKALSLKDDTKIKSEEPGNVENAFVCDSLDDFLDREAELKIGYEIPHLYAEFGIKLTRDEIVSKPNLSEKDIKEVETRYCVPISLPSEIIDLDEKKEETLKGLKRPNADDTKHCKLLKLDENKKQPVKVTQKLEDGLKSEEIFPESKNSSVEHESDDSDVRVVHQSVKDLSNVKLVSKLIALVVYPGPSAPLHPIVQYHLNKIRSYRTKVDKNWASFAASAVVVNDKQYNRKILPAYCCAKVEADSVVNNSNNNGVSAQKKVDCVSDTSKLDDHCGSNSGVKKRIKLKKCSVVLEKLNIPGKRPPWCMEHNRYNCIRCGLGKPKHKSAHHRKMLKKPVNEDLETVIVSPRASFDKKIANLLAKKVRLLKVNGDTLKSIDCLKRLTFNTVEFIKLKFVKENFLSGYLKIWYIKPETSGERFRAFLTFSDAPPLPNAVNLKFTKVSLNNLPKVITEIVSMESSFDSNEYAILHCDGKIWEIHGSLNIAFGKCDKTVDQIFTSAELPELKSLQKIAYDILHVKAVKWWVLDLTQKFQLMEVKSGNLSFIVSRGNFIDSVRTKSYGFSPLRKTTDGRVLGALILERLLPFVLIGPYYLLERNDLVLKDKSSSIPFSYYGEENVTADYPLKFFINSVIKNMKNCNKQLEGLWLYDKMCLDSTSYIEVVTTNLCVPPSNKYSSIYIEHGYSLNSLTNPTPSGTIPGIIKRQDGKEEFRKITVYLYFNIHDLGFVEGELKFDNSVIISHPLDKRKKMKSHKIGDWFLRIIRRRIEFIPKNLVVRWFITKHKEDLRDRRPFNKFFLGGAHILTKNGVFYLLEMSDSKMEKLGIDRNEVVKAIAQSEVITEVKELKNLSNLLTNDSQKSLTMHEVLTKAFNEIKELRSVQRALKKKKLVLERKKFILLSSLIKRLNQSRISFHFKLEILDKFEPFFKNEKGNLKENFKKILKICEVGRSYLRRYRKYNALIKDTEAAKGQEQSINQSPPPKPQLVPSPIKTIIQDQLSPPKKLIPAILNASRKTLDLNPSPNYSEIHIQIEKLNPVPEKLSSFRKIYPKILINSNQPKEPLEENGKKETPNTEPTVDKSQTNFKTKNDKFLKLTSPDLPENIKLCWKNWTVNKLEVV